MSQTTLLINVTSPTSTSITIAPQAPWTLSGDTLAYPPSSPIPVPAHSHIGRLTIGPSGWSGALALSGADAASFGVSSSLMLNVGAVALATKDYSIMLTATP